MTEMPYKIFTVMTDQKLSDSYNWCEQQFGSIIDKQLENCIWWVGNAVNPYGFVFYFKNESDAILFSLKWL